MDYRTWTKKTYRWTNKEKSPIIDKMRTCLQKRGVYNKRKLVSEISNVAISTLNGWFDGDTIDPRTETSGAVITSLGFDWELVDRESKFNIDKELERAAAWYLERGEERKRPKSPKKPNGHSYKGRRT